MEKNFYECQPLYTLKGSRSHDLTDSNLIAAALPLEGAVYIGLPPTMMHRYHPMQCMKCVGIVRDRKTLQNKCAVQEKMQETIRMRAMMAISGGAAAATSGGMGLWPRQFW